MLLSHRILLPEEWEKGVISQLPLVSPSPLPFQKLYQWRVGLQDQLPKDRQLWGRCSNLHGVPQEARRGKERSTPRNSGRSNALLTPWFQRSSFRSGREYNSVLGSHSWCLLTALLGTNTEHHIIFHFCVITIHSEISSLTPALLPPTHSLQGMHTKITGSAFCVYAIVNWTVWVI